MKKLFILFVILITACNSADAPDCFRKTGNRISRSYEVPSFVKIQIKDNVHLTLKQGVNTEVRVEAGENLLDGITVEVKDDTIIIGNDNSCELFRDYDNVTVFITAPDINEIRNASIGDVVSQGVLEFRSLFLVSLTSGNIENVRKSGDFRLDVQCDRFFVQANGFSRFFIKGYSREARLIFADEIPLFEGVEFEIEDLTVLQTSANVMRVNPTKSIVGEIRGTGDIIAVNRPEIVEVDQYYTGRLIFED